MTALSPHDHGHPGAVHRWRLRAAFALVAAYFVVELTAAVLSGSLALLGDAGHMAADVVALGAALVATQLATKADPGGRRTFGSYRAEVFASGLAVLLMILVSVYVVAEALARWRGGPAEASGLGLPMLLVGGLGLAVNVAAVVLLRGGAAESLTVRGAYLEVLADALGSVGVIVAGVLVTATGHAWWDTVLALVIAVFVVVRAVLLGREVLAVLAQHAPAHLHPDDVAGALADLDGVLDVHDLHLWTLTSGMTVATAHLVTAEGADAHAVLDAAGALMRDRFAVEHATLQVEPLSHTGCDRIAW